MSIRGYYNKAMALLIASNGVVYLTFNLNLFSLFTVKKVFGISKVFTHA